MFAKPDTTKPSRGWRKTVIAALTGIACVAIGAQVFDISDDQNNISIEAIQSFTQVLADHRDYTAHTKNVIDNLVKEGVKNIESSDQATDALIDAYVHLNSRKMNPADTLKKKTKPALEGGAKQLKDNVDWGGKTGKESVEPKKVQLTFADSQKFNTEIVDYFPSTYTRVTLLRQDLKVHHFDLLSTMQEVQLLAKSTKDNLKRSVRKLSLRKQYEGSGLNASIDEKIWKYEVKY